MIHSNEKFDVVFLWKQNDSGIYGRRADMMLKELAECEWVDKIIEFDAPMDIDTLEKYQEIIKEKENTHYGIIYNNAFKAYYGNKYIYGVRAYTYIYSKRGSNRKDYTTMNSYFEYVDRAIKANDIGKKNKVLLWNCPINYELKNWVEYLKPDYIVSDIIDDQRAWATDEKVVQRMTDNYMYATEVSDLVLVNCQEMYERVQALNPKVNKSLRLIPNGCESFNQKVAEKPELLKDMKGPVIGQVSNLEKKIDIELLEKCAKTHPEWNIVLIGSVHASDGIERLESYKNVYLTGPIPYEEVKNYIANFDVAMIAHRIVSINKAMNPLKLYVYCSLGASVVSTDIPGIDDLKTVIRVADSHDGFIQQIEEALKTPHIYSEEDIALVNKYSWKEKVEKIRKIVYKKKKQEIVEVTVKAATQVSVKKKILRKGKKLFFAVPGVKWLHGKWKKVNNKIKSVNHRIDVLKKKDKTLAKKIKENFQRIVIYRRHNNAQHQIYDAKIKELESQVGNLKDQLFVLKTDMEDCRQILIKTAENPLPLSISLILYYNTPIKNMKTLVEKIREASGEKILETIIVNQCSDNEWEMVVQEGITFINADLDASYAEIMNEVMNQSKGEYCVLMKNVCNISANWLKEMMLSWQRNEKTGMVTANAHFKQEVVNDRGYSLSDIGRIRFKDYMEKEIYRLAFDMIDPDFCQLEHNKDVQSCAVWGNCFMIDKLCLQRSAGFDALFTEGFEGLDLSLRLYKEGYKNYVNPNVFVLCIPESENYHKNYIRFCCRWQSYLTRRMLEEKLQGEHLLTVQRFTVGIIGEPTEESNLNDFLLDCRESGYDTKIIQKTSSGDYQVGQEVDLLLLVNVAPMLELLKNKKNDLYSVLWIENENIFDLNVAVREKYDGMYCEESGMLYEVIEGHTENVSTTEKKLLACMCGIIRRKNTYCQDEKAIDILGGMPNNQSKYSWGDYHYALSLKREFEKCGYKANVKCYSEWFEKSNSKYKLVLRGIHEYYPKIEGETTIMWNISHPADVSLEEYNSSDIVYIASEKLVSGLVKEIKVPTKPLLQCTDDTIMTYRPEKDKEYELLFIGNSRGVYRKIIHDLLPTNHNLTVYGRAWEKYIPEQYIAGTYIDNEKVGQAYHNAKILLNDHWDDMRDMGVISNRLFDALAVEAFVISDHIADIEDVFDGAVVTYKDSEDLKQKIDYYLAHPEERAQKAKRGQEIVLKKHTFKNRVESILADIELYNL